MFRRSRSRFAVLIHASNLLVRSEDGSFAPGGVFTWRCVDGKDVDDAVANAIQSVVTSDGYREEVDPASAANARFEAEEIRQLEGVESQQGTGFVFYVNTDESAGH
jgi:hypothetical protein